MRKLFMGIALAMLALGTLPAQVNIFFDEANAPFMYMGEFAPTGVYPALVREAFIRMNTPATLQALPWKRVIVGIDAGTNGVGGLYMNSERLEKYDFSKPLFEEKLALYVMTGKTFKYTDISGFNGKIVGVHRGWTYGDEFDAAVASGKVKKEDVSTDEQNVQKLAKGYIDVIIANPEAADPLIQKLGFSSVITKMPDLFSSVSVYVAFNKKANMKTTLDKFNTTIAVMKKDGSYDKIVTAELTK